MGLREVMIRPCAVCRGTTRVMDNGLMPEHPNRGNEMCSGAGHPPDYSDMYWEDFCVFVIQKGLPYTERDASQIVSRYGDGLHETYGDSPEVDLGMKDAREAIAADAKQYNNPPRDA